MSVDDRAVSSRTENARTSLVSASRKVDSLNSLDAAWNALAEVAQGAESHNLQPAEQRKIVASLAALGLHTPSAALTRTLTHASVSLGKAPTPVEHEDLVTVEEREARVLGNLAALADRGSAVASCFDSWREARREEVWARAIDGNIVRGGLRWRDWGPWIDARSAAVRLATEHVQRLGLEPIILEGICPPWLLIELCKATPRRADGSWPRITIVQEDPLEFLDGLAHASMEEWLSQARVEVIVGPAASDALAKALAKRMDYELSGPVISLESVRTRVRPGPREVLMRAVAGQRNAESAARRELDRTYANRTPAWWSRRFATLQTNGEPLRVLVPTCRYSTFIQHSSVGLAAAFERAGCEAQVLIEPDDCTRFMAGAYLNRIAEFKPDLVVLINYARAHLPGKVPAEVPFVCWIQDAMPHLFDERIGAAHGPLDFLAGHLHGELFTRFRYPSTGLIPSPVVADDVRFHAGPVEASLLRDHACDVAIASHHSESPEDMHDRLMRECAGEAELGETCRRLRPRIETAVRGGLETSPLATIGVAVRECIDAVYGRRATPRVESIVRRVYAVPLADRLMRHETLHWAADLAERHGWRLHVYGRGWERHERFAKYARGELSHGEALRAAYQAARVHLHASVNTIVHQRVMECALSGGLPLCRVHGDVMASIRAWAQQAAVVRDRPTPDAAFDIDPARHPEAAAALAMHADVGDSSRTFLRISGKRVATLTHEAGWKSLSHHAGWLLGDLGSLTFSTRAGLEERIGRAIEDDTWRAACSHGIAMRVRAELSLSAFASRVLRTVSRTLAEKTQSGGTARAA